MSAGRPEIFAAFRLPATVAVLLYGNHPDLATRVLGSLLRHTPPDWFHLRIGLNAVGDETREIVRHVTTRRPDTLVVDSPVNIFKCPMMRRLIQASPLPDDGWFLWFDDDTYATRADWLHGLAFAVEGEPGAELLGQPFVIDVPAPTVAAIRAAPWFRGRALDPPPGGPADSARIIFPTGGFWAIRNAAIHRLDWPDSRLIHHSDDFLLAEAIRQTGGTFVPYHSGLAINEAARRAPADTPPGL